MRRLIGLVIGLPLLLLAASFAGSNLQTVSMELFPLPVTVEISIALVAYVALFAGFVAGALVAWFGAGRVRQRARENEIAARRARAEVETLRKQADRNATAAIEGPKSAPPKAVGSR